MARHTSNHTSFAGVLRLIAAVAVLPAVLSVGPSAALAESPSPPPTSTPTPPSATHTPSPGELTPAYTPVLSLFPFQLVLSGPSQSVAGEPAVYQLRYMRVTSGDGRPLLPDRGIVFLYGRDASLVAIGAASGPSPVDLGPQNPGLSENVQLPADAGEIEFVIQPHVGFTGMLDVSVYVRGTSIAFPDGSVVLVRTQIVAPSAHVNLPGTGSGTASTSTAALWRGVLYGALGGALAAATIAATLLRRSKIR